MSDSLVGGLATLGTMVITLGLTIGACDFVSNMHQQTALLSRIAVAAEQTAANTRAPVDIRLAGFTPETQHALEDALQPGRKK